MSQEAGGEDDLKKAEEIANVEAIEGTGNLLYRPHEIRKALWHLHVAYREAVKRVEKAEKRLALAESALREIREYKNTEEMTFDHAWGMVDISEKALAELDAEKP